MQGRGRWSGRLRRSVGGVLALGVAVGGLLFGSPTLTEPRVEAPHGVVGVSSWMSYVWIIRTPHGAALVDAGADPDGTSLMRELGAMGLGAEDVHTVLLTHGHWDHWAAAARFPKAHVVAGKGDAALVRGEEESAALGARLGRRMGPEGAQPRVLVELEGEQVLDVDGVPIRFIPLPGHTRGSAAYLYRDLLFTGDSLNRRRWGAVDFASRFYTDDAAQNRASLERLLSLDFAATADGHQGVALDAKKKLARLLGR
ncbi:MAG: MBL fold metallo-hydrolase [Myxococcales bacterium]